MQNKLKNISNKRKIKILIACVVSVLAIYMCISFCKAYYNVDKFTVLKEKEDATLMERFACNIKGYKLYSHQELIDKGLVFSEEKKEALKIAKIIEPIVNFKYSEDNVSTAVKVEQCKDVGKALEDEEANVNTDKLEVLFEDSKKYVNLCKYELQSIDDKSTSLSYSNESFECLKKINSDLDKLGCKNK